MFHTIRIERAGELPPIERHVPAPEKNAKAMAGHLARLYRATSVTVTPVTDPALIAKLIIKIGTLALLITVQLGLAFHPADNPLLRAPRPGRVATRYQPRRKDDA